MIKSNLLLIFLFSLLLSSSVKAQEPLESFDDDLSAQGDIFSDFNDDVEAEQVMEDERFYRYARFFGVNIGLGLTTFTGNRGDAYTDSHPSFSFSLVYFLNFQNAFVIGIEHSRHIAYIDSTVESSPSKALGAIDTTFLRPFIGFRYYLDTTDLGTALTYSNPYFVGRFEYWYHTNKFSGDDIASNEEFEDESSGALGTAVGIGLEFPIEMKKTYFNVEFLYHTVNFEDKFTSDYAKIEGSADQVESTNGYPNLIGDGITLFFNYHISW